MQDRDVYGVTRVHLASFQGFFLTFLGSRFLSELYAGIVTDPAGIAFVYRKENHILGFIAGMAQPSGFYRRLLRVLTMPQQAGPVDGCGTLKSPKNMSNLSE
jgi:hypothetical protein